MANWRHRLLLKYGLSFVWNRWRKLNPGLRPDLSGVRLECSYLFGNNLSDANLSEAKFCQTRMGRCNCSSSNLTGIDFTCAEVSECDFRRSDLSGAILIGADCSGANFTGANLSNADLRACSMLHADLSDAIVDGALVEDFRPVNVRGLPQAPKFLRLDEHGERQLVGREAARFFQSLAVVQIVVSKPFDETEEWAYRGIPVFMHKAGMGAEVSLSRILAQESCTVLEFEAPKYEDIYEVLPILLRAFSSSEAIHGDTLLATLRDTHDNSGPKKVQKTLVTAIASGLSRAYEITSGIEAFRKAIVEEIREPARNRSIDVYKNHTDQEKACQIVNHHYHGPVTIEYQGEFVIGDQSNIGRHGSVIAMGDDAQINARNISTQWHNQRNIDIDAVALATELAELINVLKMEANHPSHYEALLSIKKAEEAAKSGDTDTALTYMKAAGSWAWDTATKIGIGIATAAAKAKLGI